MNEKNEEIVVQEFKDDEYVQLQNEFDQIRTCIGMYISYRGTPAALHLFKEIFNNALDECVNENSPANKIDVYYEEGTRVIMVTDNGRGIPFDKLKDVVTKKHTSTKFGRKFNVDSAGENGVGLKVTAALSDYFSITSYRGLESKCIEFDHGKMNEMGIKKERKNTWGLCVKFIPSEMYLGKINMTVDDICDWFRCMSYICPKGIKMKLIAQKKKSDTMITRSYEHTGLDADVDYLAEALEFNPITLETSQIGDAFENEMKLDMSFSYDKTIDVEAVDSYCNYVHTIENGMHVDGCESAICGYFTREAKRLDANNKYEIIYEDCKKGLVLAVNCRAVQPQFGGQTKEKVNNPMIRTDGRKLMSKALDEYFINNQAVLKKAIDYLRKIARIRIEAHSIKGIDIKKPTTWLDEADIKKFYPLENRNYKGYKELLISEGDSAAGALQTIRNPKYQALFLLTGVIDNAFEQTAERALKNDTLQRLVKVLGCGIGSEFNIANLKWNRIIIMTDADVDGSNITSLLCAFFARHMPEVITEERLYKSIPPLYSVDSTSKKNKGAGKEFLFDKHEYYEIYNHLVADNIEMSLVYQINDTTGDYVELNKKDKITCMEMNQMYLYHLRNLVKKTACLPIILETCCWELIHHPDFGVSFSDAKHIHSWEMKFKSVIEQDFPELVFDTTNHSLDGSYMGDSVSVIIDAIFMNNAKPLIRVMALNEAFFIRYKNKNDSEADYRIVSIGQFLDIVDGKYTLDIDQRFKGIGEVPVDLLFRSTMNPAMRKLYKITMDDVDEAMKTLTILHGSGQEASDARKKLIDNDSFTLEDIDN